MNKPAPYHAFPRPTRSRVAAARTTGAADFLRSHHKMASLLPALARMLALQKDCASMLPVMFQHCEVLRFESGIIVLAVPTTALATKLKQQLPKLQEQLLQRGWQITSIRLKVQVRQEVSKPEQHYDLSLPATALHAFAQLEQELAGDKSSAELRQALQNLLKRRHGEAAQTELANQLPIKSSAQS